MESDRPLRETDADHFILEDLRQKAQQCAIRFQEMEYGQGLEEEAAQIEKEIKKGEEELDYCRRISADYRGTGNAFDARGSDGRRQMMGNSEDQTSSVDMSCLKLPPGVEYQSDRSFSTSVRPLFPSRTYDSAVLRSWLSHRQHCWQWARASRAAV